MRTLLEISKSGLRSAERSLAVTSNNIINADTPGYTRQRVDKSPVGMQKTGFHSGLGVNITTITRMRNEMTDVLMNEKRQDMGFLKEKAKIFDQLEASMASDSGGDLDMRIGRVFDTFSELSADPQDLTVRNALITEAEQLTSKLADISRNVDRTSDLVKDSVVTTTSNINHLLSDLEGLNKSITQGESSGKPDHASLDIQVQKLEELAGLVDFESQVTEKGALQIRIGGVMVLDENKASVLRPEINDVNKSVGIRLDSGKIIDPQGGKLGAEIQMYEDEIPNLKDQLNNIASTVVNEFNAIHSQGFGLEDDTARNFFNSEFTDASNIQVNEAIRGNANHIAASAIAGEAGNGEIAAQIADLRSEPIIGGRRIVDYAVNLISTPGSNLSELRSSIEVRDSEINMLEIQQEQEAGVNVDEELSLMIQYQNAYQGAARVMAAAQDMYDTLLSVMR
ncbi:flagellar hook-associated protein FlgK [Rhodohalobacter sp. SW132]|uniref:flagellar hook-associated protein FlgK n=1 Tax=Rhodohalobacter sp. SW132 TaxID=2293433 RepID=UPI000E22C26C|nr:flagellar hook-associated protein FlgK [Rhodohalobacter sp. SW132]REL38651.1 flagellar hook-associated protein FlgK [Rhodohalobacter sp. SW132]